MKTRSDCIVSNCSHACDCVDDSELKMLLDDQGVQAVLAVIAKDCHARAETSRSHPYQSAQWARRATAIARLAFSFDGDD